MSCQFFGVPILKPQDVLATAPWGRESSSRQISVLRSDDLGSISEPGAQLTPQVSNPLLDVCGSYPMQKKDDAFYAVALLRRWWRRFEKRSSDLRISIDPLFV